MKHDNIDDILARAGHGPETEMTERAAIDRARRALLPDLKPVRSLPPAWVFTLGFIAVFAALACTAAMILGLHGIRALNPEQRALIFPTLLAAAWIAAVACSRAMRPASGTELGFLALAFATGAFPALFSLIFHGYGTAHFVHEGIPCLVAGSAVAIPTGLVIALILRRGFVLKWSAAGIAAGSLAGLSGLAMLELHCPNLKAIHVITWHVAVVALSGVRGWVAGVVADSRSSDQR